MTGKELLRKTLEAEQTSFVFGNPGSTEIPFLDALSGSTSIKFILALHEGIAVAMADGFARSSGQPGVVSVHACPGTAQSLGLLYNAWVDRSPVVVLAGQQDKRLLLKEPFLSGDLARMAEPVTKWSWEVSTIEELPIALRRAFKEATSAPTRPTFLSIPNNILDQTIDVEVADPSSYRVSGRLRGDPRDIARAAELLIAAERLVIITGTGVGRASANRALVELAELLGAPVYGDPNSFPTNHPLCLGAFERRQLAAITRSSDTVMVIGSEMFSEFKYSPDSPMLAGVKAIHIDANPWEIAKNFPIDVGIAADPGAGLRDLIDAVSELMSADQLRAAERRRERIRTLKDEQAARLEEESRGWPDTPIAVGMLVKGLREVLRDDAIIVDQAIHSSGYLKKYFDFVKPGTYYTDRGGTLGWVIGAAMGVKLAQPQRQVVAFAGDGSTMFAPQALWTAAQHNIPITTLVINNGGYMAVKVVSLAYGAEWAKNGQFIGADISGIDYPRLAESLGVAARRIVNPEDIIPTLRWGLGLGRPTLIEVVTHPRDGGYGYPTVPRGETAR